MVFAPGHISKFQNLRSGKVIITPAHAAHLITALEDSIIFEASGGKKKTIIYKPYRIQIKNTKN